MEATEGINNFLDSLKRDGEFESSGHFSLDSKTSLDKLKKFRLTNPAELVLHLVASASYRGATRIQAELSTNSLRLAYDGMGFSKSEMDSIFSSYFVAEQTPANLSRASMAIALQTIQQLDPDFVVFESWKGGTGQVMQLYEDKVWLETLESKKQVAESEGYQYLCYELRETFWNYCFPTLTRAGQAEQALLKERCGYGPARLWLNGREVKVATSETNFYFKGEGSPPYLPGLSEFAFQQSAPFWGMAGLIQPKSSSYWSPPGEIRWIVGGVAYCETGLAELPQGISLVVHAPDLRKDLSHSQIIHDDRYRQRFEEVKDSLRALILSHPRFGSEDYLKTWAEPKRARPAPVRRRQRP
ncbi:MAG: hypothetical protein U0931_25545 [Vulcanimicrobiota bacterium]